MAIKKYISPDSFKNALRDNLKKVTGQYWYVKPDGNVSFGDPERSSDPRILKNFASFIFNTSDVFGRGDLERQVQIKKMSSGDYSGAEYTPYNGEYGILWDGQSAERVMVLEVTHLSSDGLQDLGYTEYDTLTKFSLDMQELFKNPSEGYYFEESFNYETEDDDVSASSQYNFLIEKYENLSSVTQESGLPNFYAVSMIDNETLGLENTVRTHTLLKNTVPEADIRVDSVALTSYLSTWTDSYTNLTFTDASEIIENGKNIIQTYGSYADGIATNGDKVEDLNQKSVKLPFSVTLSVRSEDKPDITQGSLSPVADVIGERGLFSIWTSNIISSIDPFVFSQPDEEQIFEFSNKTYYDAEGKQRVVNASPALLNFEQGNTIGEANTNSFSHLVFEDNSDFTSEEAFKPAQVNKRLFLDSSLSSEIEKVQLLNEDYLLNISNAPLILDNLEFHNDLVHQGGASYEKSGRMHNGLFNRGDAAKSQTVAYRVKKYRGASATGTPVQDIWIPNAKQQGDILEYIDSQVRYGEQYTYDVRAYKYVFGTKYRYEQHLAPTVLREEIEFTGDYPVIGFVFKWFGAKNLFDQVSLQESDNGPALPIPNGDGDTFYGAQAWEIVATYLNEYGNLGVSNTDETIVVPTPWSIMPYNPSDLANHDVVLDENVTDTFWLFNHLISPTQYPILNGNVGQNEQNVLDALVIQGVTGQGIIGAPLDILQWPAWGENSRFFTLEQIRTIMRKAWYTKPTGVVNGVLTTYQSWQEMWNGLEWNDNWINDNIGSPMHDALQFGNSQPQSVRAVLRGEEPAYVAIPDPGVLNLNEWFALFMGYDDGGTDGTSLSPPSVPPQPMPPSHHRINGFGIPAIRTRSGPRDASFGFQQNYRGNIFVGLEDEDAGDEGFHSGGKGVSELTAGEGAPVFQLTGYTAQYRLHMLPSTRIIEVPYATVTTAVLSKPPPTPEIEFIPYRGINNKLLFTFDATFAEQEEVAIPITSEDVALFEKHRQAQSKDPGEAILFRSDDTPTYFEVYRLDYKPSRYTDFDGARRAQVSTLISDENNIIRSRSSDYVENLQPNIKYYYTFRTVDFHGNVSNPTAIYEIELVDDGGAIYPLINLYELPVIEANQPSRTMKKMIQIYPVLDRVTPSIEQNLLISGEQIKDPNDIPTVGLGLQGQESIWDKKFKIRLTSTKTGKKIDMNVTFAKKDERT